MMYAELVNHISDEEFKWLYDASEFYLVGDGVGGSGNLGFQTRINEFGQTCHPSGALLEYVMRSQTLLYMQDPDYTSFVLREVGTDLILNLQTGILKENGAFHSLLSYFGPDSQGSSAWVHFPPSNKVVANLMSPTGIKRCYTYPLAKNIADCIIDMGCHHVATQPNGDKIYLSPWDGDVDYLESEHESNFGVGFAFEVHNFNAHSMDEAEEITYHEQVEHHQGVAHKSDPDHDMTDGHHNSYEDGNRIVTEAEDCAHCEGTGWHGPPDALYACSSCKGTGKVQPDEPVHDIMDGHHG